MIDLITFACYGCHLHGEESGSVDRHNNLFGSRIVDADPDRSDYEQRLMDQSPYHLDATRREIVLAALMQRCSERRWNLLAAHVRTNHVHIIVGGDVRPERIMNDLKSYASRSLNRHGIDEPGRKRWARHGSTRGCGIATAPWQRSATSSRSRANRWRCLWLACSDPEDRSL